MKIGDYKKYTNRIMSLQDVQEFLLHILTLLERYNKDKVNPGECFKFEVEERFQCGQSKKVKYLTRSEVCLGLNIPMEAAVNKEEVGYSRNITIFPYKKHFRKLKCSGF